MGNSNLKWIKFIFLFLIFYNFNFAQYREEFHDLIETTAKRNFDKVILENYFSSADSNKIIAALISIAHSEDSSFINKIIELDFNKYGKWISFALGQIRNSEIAKDFLWKKLSDNQCRCQENIFYALGKLGNETDLQRLCELYFEGNTKNIFFDGIEEAILQFRLRNFQIDKCKKILVNELTDFSTPSHRKKKILFTLGRSGSDSTIIPFLTDILHNSSDDEMIQLSLMNLRILKYFPSEQKILTELNQKSDGVRIELMKSLVYSPNDLETITLIQSILASVDENENILIEALKTLREIKWKQTLIENNTVKESLKRIINLSSKKKLIEEAFLTYKFLFPLDELLNDKSVLNNLTARLRIQLLHETKKVKLNFNDILNIYSQTTDLKEKLSALEFILTMSDTFKDDDEFQNFIFNSLSSDDAAVISIASDAIDSLFISNNSERLKDIILQQSTHFRNNPDFIEAEFSLINLAKRISEEFYNKVRSNLSDTKLFSLKKFLYEKDKSIEPQSKDFSNLDTLLTDAFRYSRAIIKTNKGNIELKLKPELAPVTVGSFIYLVKKNFYNGIIFHRVVPGFVIQAGDPTGTGWGGAGYEIISEFSNEEFFTGKVGIASAGKDTESSQFFIMQGYYPHLNGRYTLFAEVINGIDVVMKISEDDKIISVQLIR